MAAETQTLNFGPEWLRALSSGGSVTSPPLSPALPKYKLADYRYGREEMLALYVKDNKIPLDLQDKEFLSILQDEPLPPLALVPFTEEEQRNFSMSVNSAAVLRLTGRGGGTVAGAPRGRSSSRGRGRGRGEGGFYQRSFDEVEGGFGRGGREMHRSQSWEERGDRRFEKPGRKDPDVAPAHFQLNPVRSNYEEGGAAAAVARKHEFTRSESENWRMSREEQSDGPRSAGWRELPEQRRRFGLEPRGEEEQRGYRRARSTSGSLEDEKDSLPEWCLEDADEEMGTFDSSGAFLSLKVRGYELSTFPSLKKASKEPIPEEQELDFRPSEEGEDQSEQEESDPEEGKELDRTARKETERREDAEKSDNADVPAPSLPVEPKASESSPPSLPERPTESPPERVERLPGPELNPARTTPVCNNISQVTKIHPEMLPSVPTTQQKQLAPAAFTPIPFPAGMALPPTNMGLLPDIDDDEGMKHLEQVEKVPWVHRCQYLEAEKMVAYLQDNALDDNRLSAKSLEQRGKGAALPGTNEAALKWFYKDPQGEIQGPFTNQEMAEWFQAGYFTMTLLVKRGCDEVFQPLGEIIKMWGRVPFAPGPSPPPLLGDLDQERLKRQQELTALNLYQMQQLQYQYLLRQQYAQALAQQQKAALSNPQQQPQLRLLLQQYQALKMRASDQNLVPPVTRSMSVPDTGSVWELQTPSSQASAWEGSSVWDLPVDSTTQASAPEQLQQLEKVKAAKLEQERREVELRVKREEEERKRQQQEEVLRRQQQQEEERRHREEELTRRKQEEALQRQREQEAALQRQREEEAALRRQREEEERQQQEEARRRLEEEDRKQREEQLRKQQEEERRQQQEEAARWQREEMEAMQRMEEEKQRLEEQEHKRKELELQKEAQRQQELARQRQQQQEALRRLQQQQQQQQLAQMKLPSSSKWGQQSSAAALPQSQNTLSLAEIQKLEEERERESREERRQQQELMKALQQQSQQQQAAKLSGWGGVAKQPATTKSLLEIQQEEARQVQKQHKQKPEQQQNPPQNRAQNKALEGQLSNLNSSSGAGAFLQSSISNSVWGSVSNSHSSPQWSVDVGSSSIWGSAPNSKNSNMGFWDEAAKEVVPPARNSTAKSNKSNANLSNSLGVSARASKKVEEEEEKLVKLFQGLNKTQDGFTQWCEQSLHTLNTANNLDVPTFVSFLKEVESSYEVHDYMRAYLGDTPEAKEFAKHFLERRAKQKANQQQKQQLQRQQDSVWGVNRSEVQTIFQSNQSSIQQFETVHSGKKKKKQKMVRADPSLLGFSVNASSDRLNMGEIETVEDC
ncbi:GRB10-interacting GYF protein 2 isoform X2 [Acipenser ruthenus]|uniref:GRB10-interacting GYF protein 2 isoform X2 n=1 Tax=Acipenser ruthenus TaxID=7906 RepID=UPI00145A4007|nr:GRB10-interacting GYF protein 2 isoform X2 [Acipenser ruthenus]